MSAFASSRIAFGFAAVMAASLLAIALAPARADTITLHNGDRLTGRVLHLTPSTLTFETTWAGELRIPRYEVRAIETDKPVTVLRERARATEWASLKPAPAGEVVLVPEATAPEVRLPLARLRYINPKPEESGEGVSYEGRVTLAGTFLRGNEVGNRLYVEADLAARAIDWRYELNGKLRRESDEGVDSASNWLLSGHFDHFLDDDDFAYLRSAIEHDRFRDIAWRASIGAGYGRQLLQAERAKLSVRGGLDGIALRRFDEVHDTWPALGWGVDASYRLDALSAELFHNQSGYWNLVDTSRITWRSRSGLRVPLASGLTASLQLNLEWERVPAPGTHPVDATWLLGLGYAW